MLWNKKMPEDNMCFKFYRIDKQISEKVFSNPILIRCNKETKENCFFSVISLSALQNIPNYANPHVNNYFPLYIQKNVTQKSLDILHPKTFRPIFNLLRKLPLDNEEFIIQDFKPYLNKSLFEDQRLDIREI